MSGFSPEWLALREGADHRAIDHTVRRHLIAYLADQGSVHISDLGCGTGSNFRSLAPEITARQMWLLVDHDDTLLQLAAAMTEEIALASQIEVRMHQTDLSDGNLHEIAAHSDLITAAALFDLVSKETIATMVAAIAESRCAFYTTLTYDGLAAWLPEHPLNATMRKAFNAHQQSDKGFGPAAGPEGTQLLAHAFAEHGYSVLRGNSPWILDGTLNALRQETDRGWADAVVAEGSVSRAEADDWLKARETNLEAITIVGHEDLLALPPN